jgi:hypothetical protein
MLPVNPDTFWPITITLAIGFLIVLAGGGFAF